MTDQTDKPTRGRWQIPWAAILIVSIPVAYVAGYFALSEYGHPISVPSLGASFPAHRTVDYEWMMTFYEPLRAAETFVRGEPVVFESHRLPEFKLILP